MRIYEGSPRQDWEEVLRAVGSWADREPLKELLFLELDGGFLVQGIKQSMGGQWSETGSFTKETHELTDDQVGDLIGKAMEQRGSVAADHAEMGIANFYEQALRIIGKWLDSTQPRDVFFFEQGGSFVVRTFIVGAHGKVGHQLSEFTRDEIVAMIESAPLDRGRGSATPAPAPAAPSPASEAPSAGGTETQT
ncbi:MAG TPA: hypothetical protein VIC63_07985 [Candidatus Limnocylindria bacterium]|jgi:hypothetical protein